MAQLLFVGRDTRTFGPFSATQLRRFAATGKMRLTDTIWKQGQEQQVVTASQVKNLFPAPDPVQALLTVTPVLVPMEIDPPEPQSIAAAVEPIPGSFDNASCAALTPLTEGAQTSATPAFSETVPSPEPANEKPPARPPEKQRSRRAIAIHGAIITGQDGVYVQFRKKCMTCGYEDTCRSSMRIGQGVTRVHFFCKKCRKSRDVQIQGIGQ